MDPVTVIATFGGVAEWATLSAFGISRAELNETLRSGSVIRVRRGCYALPGADAVRVASVAWRGESTCVTALTAFHLPLPQHDNRIHLVRHRDRSESGRNQSTPPTIRWHSCTERSPELSPVAEAIDVAARCLSPMDQLVVLDAALHRRLMLMRDLDHFTVTGADRLSWLRHHADARTRSPAETHARVGMARARLPFEFQVSLPDVGEVDFVVDGRLVVEVDGRDYHSDSQQFLTDRRRDRAATLLGLTPLRYTGWEAIYRTAEMAAEVWDVVRLMRVRDLKAAGLSRATKSRRSARPAHESRSAPSRPGSQP